MGVVAVSEIEAARLRLMMDHIERKTVMYGRQTRGKRRRTN